MELREGGWETEDGGSNASGVHRWGGGRLGTPALDNSPKLWDFGHLEVVESF